MITDQNYLNWQKKLATERSFRWFWKGWGIYAILIVFAIGIYFIISRQWHELLLTLSAFILARVILSPLIYIFYKKERPYQGLNFKPIHSWLFSEPTVRHNSFPSDHAGSFASVTTVLFWINPVLGTLMIFVTLINGWGRVVLGYHYPLHVLAGWLVGIFSGILVIYWLAPLLFTR